MPIYCYRCIDCGKKIEQMANRPADVDCPDCSKGVMPIPMVRDYPAEKPISTFHPTSDLYLRSKKVK